MVFAECDGLLSKWVLYPGGNLKQLILKLCVMLHKEEQVRTMVVIEELDHPATEYEYLFIPKQIFSSHTTHYRILP